MSNESVKCVKYDQVLRGLSQYDLATVLAKEFIRGIITACTAVGAPAPSGLEPGGTLYKLYVNAYYDQLNVYMPVVKEGET